MSGVLHELWIEDNTVRMANDDDDHYVQVFESPEEIDEFINKLLEAKKECWKRF